MLDDVLMDFINHKWVMTCSVKKHWTPTNTTRLRNKPQVIGSSNDCGTTIYSSFLEPSAQRLVLFLFTPGQEGNVKAAVTEQELSAGVEKVNVLHTYWGLKEPNNLPKRKS